MHGVLTKRMRVHGYIWDVDIDLGFPATDIYS